MADQKQNQSNENTSSGQQSSWHEEQQSTQQNQGWQSSLGQRQPQRDDESTGWDESERERSSREPVSTANDSGLGGEPLSGDLDDSAIEDVDDQSSVSESDDEDMGGSSR